MTTPLRDQVRALEAEVATLRADLGRQIQRADHAEQERRRSAEFADTCEALGKRFAMACDRANARVKLLEASTMAAPAPQGDLTEITLRGKHPLLGFVSELNSLAPRNPRTPPAPGVAP